MTRSGDALVASELARCEAVIDRGLDAFLEVGQALTRIRDERLYRASYSTFEDYLQQRWGMARRTGYKYIDAAEVASNVHTYAQLLPSVSHAELLHRLPPTQQTEVAAQIAREHLSVKALRRVIADKQKRALVERVRELEVDGQPALLPASCQAELGDARRLPIADDSAHLVITSPPYNARLTYDGYEDWLPWADYWDGLIVPALREAYRILGPGGRLCLNMANVVRQDVPQPGRNGRGRKHEFDGRWKWKPPGAGGDVLWAIMLAPRLWAVLEEIGFLPREQLTWVKGSPSLDEDVTATPTTSTAWGTWCSAQNPVLRAVAEPIFIASKGSHSREPGDSDIEADEFKRLTKNVWFVSALKPDIDHPSAFPEELPRRLIKLYSYPGDLVVDPFMGSGTTLVAAASLGRWSYGCDISERYVQLARSRLAAMMTTEVAV